MHKRGKWGKRTALTLALGALLAGAQVQAAQVLPVLEADGLRVLRTHKAEPYNLEVRILHVGPASEVLNVRSVRVEDARGQVLQRIAVGRTAASLGEIWNRLEPLRRMEHDEIFLYEEPETALAMFEQLERSAVDVVLPLNLAIVNPGWVAGVELDLTVVAELDSSQQGSFQLRLPFDIDIFQPPAPDPRLPEGAPGGSFFRGDTHVHSAYSDCDGIFRGRFPIGLGSGSYNPEKKDDSLVSLYRAVGLQWIALTDHCYCVNHDEYIGQDNEAAFFSSPELLVIPGLEISAVERKRDGASCSNDGHNTSHLNGIGLKPDPALFPYTIRRQDGLHACDADGPIFRADAPSVQTAINRLRDPDFSEEGVVSLNHAGGTGIGEVWNMDQASFECADNPPETGMELINFDWDDNQDPRSVQLWVNERLLKGHRVAAYAGSDVHKEVEVIGATFTGVFATRLGRFSDRSIEEGLAAGHTFASSGPQLFALFAGPAGASVTAMMGETLSAAAGTPLELKLSFDDGGKPLKICFYQGEIGGTETPLPVDGANAGACILKSGTGILSTRINAPARAGYVRATAIAQADGHWRAYSSALWLQPPGN